MFEHEYIDCYRLLSSGRLQRIERSELELFYFEHRRDIFNRLRYEGVPSLRLGGDTSEYFRVDVHPRFAIPEGPADLATAPYRYLVVVTLGYPVMHFVFVEDLPDLLPFLAQLASIASATLHTSQHELDVVGEEMDAEQQETQGE